MPARKVSTAPAQIFREPFILEDAAPDEAKEAGAGKRLRSLAVHVDQVREQRELLEQFSYLRPRVPMSRLRRLPEAPTFHPSLADFADPLLYIQRIAPLASHYGIAKIVPPVGWQPPATLAARMRSPSLYSTRVQLVSELRCGNPVEDGPEVSCAEFERLARKFAEERFPLLRPTPENLQRAQRITEEVDSRRGRALEQLEQRRARVGSKAPRRSAGAAPGAAAAAEAPAAAPSSSIASSEGPGPAPPHIAMADAVEAAFWETVEGRHGMMQVLYANDNDSRAVGSLFPPPSPPAASSAAPTSPFAAAPGFNLNALPHLPASLLRTLPEEVPGLNIPWVYMGMLFASFAWHCEDHWLMSANYLAEGAPKTWYGIPEGYAGVFERALQALSPSALHRQLPRAAILHALNVLLSPAELVAAGVPVFHALQTPNSFIITLPHAFHAGFSHGFNLAEAVNFATVDWLPWGRVCAERYKCADSGRSACFSHEQVLLCTAAGELRQDILVFAELIARELREMARREGGEQRAVLRSGCALQAMPMEEAYEARPECRKCLAICYTCALACRRCGAGGAAAGSAVQGGGGGGGTGQGAAASAAAAAGAPVNHARRHAQWGACTCLRHTAFLCPCPPSEKRILSWVSPAHMEALACAVLAQAAVAAVAPAAAVPLATAAASSEGAAPL